MTDRNPQTISVCEATALLTEGALLVDVREASERSETIHGALHVPMSRIDEAPLPATQRPVIFHCRSGRRTAMNADILNAKAGEAPVYLMEGGIEAWVAAGLPVKPGAGSRPPLDQV